MCLLFVAVVVDHKLLARDLPPSASAVAPQGVRVQLSGQPANDDLH